jgi:predicted RNA-binding protein with PUA-like domain
MNYWLIKSEPKKYAWSTFIKDGHTFWDGVKNYQARNNLRLMQVGDWCLYYHSNDGKEIVGIAEVVACAYQDPSTTDERWVAVDIKPVAPLKFPVSLSTIKNDNQLEKIGLIRQSRLSVMQVTTDEFNRIIWLSEQAPNE